MNESGIIKSTIAEKLKLNPKIVSLWTKEQEEEWHKAKCTT